MMRTTGPARVRAPWNAKAGKAARRLARFSSSSALLPRLLGASTPSFWGRERDRLSRARTKTGSGMALAMHFLFRTTGDRMPQGAPNDDRHPEARNGAGTRLRPSHRKSALADLRTINPISGKPETGWRRPGFGRTSLARLRAKSARRQQGTLKLTEFCMHI